MGARKYQYQLTNAFVMDACVSEMCHLLVQKIACCWSKYVFGHWFDNLVKVRNMAQRK